MMRGYLIGVALAVLLAGGATAQPRQAVVAQTQIRAPGLTAEAGRRFLVSAVHAFRADGQYSIAYDFATGCALVTPLGARGAPAPPPAYYASASPPRSDLTARDLANTRSVEVVSMLRNRPQPEPACVERLESAYGEAFTGQARRLGSITNHAVAVLRGQAMDGRGRTATDADIRSTEAARTRVARLIAQPILLGVVESGDRTIVIVGDPRASVRWIAGYRNRAGGGWQFEGAEDGGIVNAR